MNIILDFIDKFIDILYYPENILSIVIVSFVLIQILIIFLVCKRDKQITKEMKNRLKNYLLLKCKQTLGLKEFILNNVDKKKIIDKEDVDLLQLLYLFRGNTESLSKILCRDHDYIKMAIRLFNIKGIGFKKDVFEIISHVNSTDLTKY